MNTLANPVDVLLERVETLAEEVSGLRSDMAEVRDALEHLVAVVEVDEDSVPLEPE